MDEAERRRRAPKGDRRRLALPGRRVRRAGSADAGSSLAAIGFGNARRGGAAARIAVWVASAVLAAAPGGCRARGGPARAGAAPGGTAGAPAGGPALSPPPRKIPRPPVHFF